MEIPLNILNYTCKIRIINGKKFILDKVRNRFVAFTPEEWVRQYIIHFFSKNYKYPLNMMQVERTLSYENIQYRPDILIYENCNTPFILIECKAPNIELNIHTLEQISRYNTMLGAKILIITNGINIICWGKKNDFEYDHITRIPTYEEIKSNKI